MRTLRTVAELRAGLDGPRRDGARIGLVPTMGALHEGHLSLIRRARAECETVVVSLFVNPRQFDEGADLAAYPRDEAADARAAADAGADILFAPAPDEVYPEGFATVVSVGGPLTERLEGAHRGRAHFDGVTTVVTKLLCMVGPNVAYFGQKDVQQAFVIRRLVRDLDLPVRIELCPIVREPDGLAMSSRNARLHGPERERATALHRALLSAAEIVARGDADGRDPDPDGVRAAALEVLDAAGVETEYLEIVSPDTLERVTEIDRPVLALVAARVGAVRLIDNHMLSTARVAAGSAR